MTDYYLKTTLKLGDQEWTTTAPINPETFTADSVPSYMSAIGRELSRWAFPPESSPVEDQVGWLTVPRLDLIEYKENSNE